MPTAPLGCSDLSSGRLGAAGRVERAPGGREREGRERRLCRLQRRRQQDDPAPGGAGGAAPLRWESLGARPSASRDAAATRVEAAARVGLWAALAAVGAAERRGSRALRERLGDGSNYTICRAAVCFARAGSRRRHSRRRRQGWSWRVSG